jgi:hypothetical protein
MISEQAICFPIYSRSFRSVAWGRAAVEVAENIAAVLGMSFTHMTCVHVLGKKSPLKSEHDYEWNGRTRERLSAVLDMRNPESLTFTAMRPDLEYPTLWIDMHADDPYQLLYIEWRVGNIATSPRLPAHLGVFLELLSAADPLTDVLYALVSRMSVAALPGMYFAADADVPNMTQEEDRNSLTWYAQREDFWRKVRGVYWGNLLSAAHLAALGGAAQFALDIASIVGEDLVVRLGEDRIFFMMPDMDESRIEVERLFANADLLMIASDEDDGGSQ